jgi:hypothetical protein
MKAREYYNKFDLSPAYYAATTLHPRYKNYCNVAWADQPAWLELNNRNFEALWASYRGLPKPHTRPKPKASNIDDAINNMLNLSAAMDNEEDEFEQWKRCEPAAGKESDHAKNPILYWVGLRDRYPNLSRLALDVLSIPASSCECERCFSELGDLLEPCRQGISPELLAALHCTRRWRRAGFGAYTGRKGGLTDDQMDAVYKVNTWPQC